MHFPDTDPRWKGADSLQFLKHALDLATRGRIRPWSTWIPPSSWSAPS